MKELQRATGISHAKYSFHSPYSLPVKDIEGNSKVQIYFFHFEIDSSPTKLGVEYEEYSWTPVDDIMEHMGEGEEYYDAISSRVDPVMLRAILKEVGSRWVFGRYAYIDVILYWLSSPPFIY